MIIAPSDSGTIHPKILYTLEGLKARLQITAATLRSARRAGLCVHRKHGRGFILGADWIRYVMEGPAETAASSGQRGISA